MNKQLTRDKECSQIWIHMAGELIYILQIRTWFIFCFIGSVQGKKHEKSHVDAYGRIIHVYIYILNIHLFGLRFIS